MKELLAFFAALSLLLTSACAMAADYQADIIIVGAGGAGMAAAISAHDAGASVIILEQMGYAGGNTSRSEGGMNAAETKSQAALGITDSVQTMIDDTMKGGKNLSDLALVTFMAENSAATVDWLTDLGMDLSGVAQGAGATNPRMHRSADGAKIGGVLTPILMKNVQERGIQILYDTEAKKLIREDGVVNGVVAVNQNGEEVTFKGNAVILTTGGFGANEALFTQYRPDLAGFKTTNHPGATGEGIVMAQEVGAAVVDMDQIQTNPTVEPTTNIVLSETVRGNGAIFVNQSGKRFTSEMLTRDVLSTAILEQEGQYAYEIFDQGTMDSMKALQDDYAKGIVREGATIEELATVLGIDPAVMVETMDTWNKAVAEKNDAEFGRETGMDVDLSHAPFYAIKISPAVHYTMGGVKINTNTEVIDTEGNVIEGLYAAGEVTGGVHGGNRLGGNAVADIMVYGKHAGEVVAAYVSTKEPLEVIAPEAAALVPQAQGNFKDGVYEGEAAGRNGQVKVSVKVEDGNIVALDVLESDETPMIFQGAWEHACEYIISNQNTDVDNVSGATISMAAIRNAVSNALEAAR